MTSGRGTLPKVFVVLLKRSNGHLVREYDRTSKYAAKCLKKRLEETYDESYYVEVVEHVQ